ncbi:MAG TPA: hypothetical protein VHC40_07455 [Rhizomicrobium sp.]|jgi:hypothetical protein|nr:hypothetical protein [Rhizomicrobium sp.]
MKRFLLLLAVLLLPPICAAQARPRDEAMAVLYRCNGLDSDRQWLDCYYGAAQPARAALGLKPALPDQIRLAQSPPMGSPARPSDVRSRVIASAGNCYGEPDDRDWLDCYYRAAQPIREQLGLAAPAPRPVQPSPVAPPAMASFGDARPVDRGMLNQIVSRMSAYSFDAHMIFTVTLANGQTWQQIEGDTDAARWKKPPAAYLVTIRRGFSGSFILNVRNEPHSFRVRRIR